MMNRELYRPADIVEMLGVAPITVNRWIRNGALTAITLNPAGQRKRYVITRNALLEFLGEFD